MIILLGIISVLVVGYILWTVFYILTDYDIDKRLDDVTH